MKRSSWKFRFPNKFSSLPTARIGPWTNTAARSAQRLFGIRLRAKCSERKNIDKYRPKERHIPELEAGGEKFPAHGKHRPNGLRSVPSAAGSSRESPEKLPACLSVRAISGREPFRSVPNASR